MAYCSNCAAVLDPNLKFCSRCGQATGFAAAVPLPVSVSPSAAAGSPPVVKIAIALLVFTFIVSILSAVNYMARYSRNANSEFLTRTFGFDILWILFVAGLWMRQNWARFAVLVLVVWGTGQLVYNIIRYSASSNFGIFVFSLPLAVAALRIVAAVLLFQSASNAWFKR